MPDNRKVMEKSIGNINFVLYMFPSTGPHLVAYGKGRSNLGNTPLVGMGGGWIGVGEIGYGEVVAGDDVWVRRWTTEKRISLERLSAAELQDLSKTFGLAIGKHRVADLYGSAVWPAVKEWVCEHPRLAKQFAVSASDSGVGAGWYERALEENAAPEDTPSVLQP